MIRRCAERQRSGPNTRPPQPVTDEREGWPWALAAGLATLIALGLWIALLAG